MRVLVDIVHPADVLFFRAPMRIMAERGDDIEIVSRHKDVACELLDEFGLKHRPVSRAGTGLWGLASELIQRDLAVFDVARRFRPHIMVGLGGVAISHAGRVLGIPAISFYAADTANLQTRLTWPFIDHLYVPEAYAGHTPAGRTTRFPGVKELSYFHPENFRADDRLARKNGWEEGQENYFVRTVSWRANHDIGKQGWSDETLIALVEMLAARGRVHISSERSLPERLSGFAYRGKKNELHHLLAKCRLYVGESATMAHEACLLGVASIYDGSDHPGTTRQLAGEKLLVALRQPPPELLFATIESMLGPGQVEYLATRRGSYLARHGNLATFIVDAADRHARR